VEVSAIDTSIFRIRAANRSDKGYITSSIYNSWIHCPKNHDRSVNTLNKKINLLWEKALIKVVCLAEDATQIVGFVVCQPAGKSMLIHCLFVRAAFRRIGIATDLLNAIAVTHPVAVQTLNFCDEGLLLPKVKGVFNEFYDYSHQWEPDRKDTHGT
jgi:GNAT superfamily N-acetyltransferase